MYNTPEHVKARKFLLSIGIKDTDHAHKWSVVRLFGTYPVGHILANIEKAHHSPTWAGKRITPNAGRVIGACRENWAQWEPTADAARKQAAAEKVIQQQTADEVKRRADDEAREAREREDAAIASMHVDKLRGVITLAIERVYVGALAHKAAKTRELVATADADALRQLIAKGPLGAWVRTWVDSVPESMQ
jgi:hypothetical protein